MLYPYTHLSESQLLDKVETHERRREARRSQGVCRASAAIVATSPVARSSALDYRFDVCSDYGAFRDLQRHRMLTIEWQELSPVHGYNMPEAVEEAGIASQFQNAMERSADLYDALRDPFPAQAPYALSLGLPLRYSMQFNAREAMHMLELRTSPCRPPRVPPHLPRDAPPNRRTSRPQHRRRDDGLRRLRRLRTRPLEAPNATPKKSATPFSWQLCRLGKVVPTPSKADELFGAKNRIAIRRRRAIQ